jgi:predicted AAA+ superfamily ATPase
MIERSDHRREIVRLLRHNPVVAILGARQVGKTTLAREIANTRKQAHIFDLERSQDLIRLSDPELTLGPLRGLVVLDEIQRRPELFPALRVLADRPRTPARFLVLGSASPDLMQQSSESLAGRVAFYELPGLSLSEVGSKSLDRLWLRGGFPRSYTARSIGASVQWRDDFVRTFLERDVPQLGITIPAATLDRFWSMLSHYHGQLWNGSELARAFGVSHHVVRRYLEALEATFMVRTLRPWMANLSKRQVKSPRIYLRDSGILHHFLNTPSLRDLERHPKVGASWEGFIIESLLQHLRVDSRHSYFWRTHQGAEIDLIIQKGGKLRGFEIKRTVAPSVTPSMRTAIEDLGLDRIDVVHAGTETFALARKIMAVAAHELTERISG